MTQEQVTNDMSSKDSDQNENPCNLSGEFYVHLKKHWLFPWLSCATSLE